FYPPPTTALYTLSLHDALPISRSSRRGSRPRSACRGQGPDREALRRGRVPGYPVQEARPQDVRHRGLSVILVRTEYSSGFQAQGDRKSTRLNSSHVKISYAVFC